MDITKTTIGLVVGVSLIAGAAGALVATRAGRTAAAAPETAPAIAPAVEESEGVVTPAPVEPIPEPSRAARPAPVARAVPARRPEPERARPVSPVVAVPEPVPTAPEPVPAPIVPAPIEPPRIAEAPPVAPEPLVEELELPAQSVIGLQLESSVSSETARLEDEVVARVTRDVRVGDQVAIPAGSKAHGEVTMVDRGARLRERARLGVRFTSIVLADGTRLPIDTEPIYREGDSVRNENAAKIGGGAIGGAIIGGILGGAKGAAIGGSIGAGAGTAATVAGGRNAATLPSGTPVTVRIERPVSVTVER
jgi:hypothetical protein